MYVYTLSLYSLSASCETGGALRRAPRARDGRPARRPRGGLRPAVVLVAADVETPDGHVVQSSLP